MPNHVHALISFVATGQSINTIIGDGKRLFLSRVSLPSMWNAGHGAKELENFDSNRSI